ncbi:M16 family metallopeptidase [Crateriforma conspicua]|uniref:Insulinase (Peptidase family M16) n=1 Tax=Crateriforma conspicua TaxID=2527996 RepID=A0A5C5Y8I7_9PLAN|nr:pitrilysin family protein [Crateriforma conspicua]TWT71987.1 Insulinase (Peptidase family M16) [Crateriforma conspicua]
MPEFKQAELPNGLRVVAEVDRRGYSAAMGYFVRAGARDEVDREAGLSHFLEHMMFKGTDKRSAADVNRELDELGGNSNAYTTEEQTVYYAAVLPKFQDRLVELLTDMLSPALRDEDFDTERQVILEEIAKYEDQPPFGAFERAMENHFTPRGLGRRVLGTPQSIAAMTSADMRAYFHRMYRPENIVLAASGNVDFDSLVDDVATLTASWSQRPECPTPKADPADTVPDGVSDESRLPIHDASQAYLVKMMPGPSMRDADRYAARMLLSVLADDGGSRLFWELIDTGRAEVAAMWPQEFIDDGAIFSYLVCPPSELDSCEQLMDDLLGRLVQRPEQFAVTDDELKQAIGKASAACIMASERPGNRLFGIGSRWLTCGEYVSTDQLLDLYRGVDLAAVMNAAEKYLQPTSVTRVLAAADTEPVG